MAPARNPAPLLLDRSGMPDDKLPENLRPTPAPEGRPPDETESGSRHHFVVVDDAYACSRCGRRMTPDALEETCPVAQPLPPGSPNARS